MDVSGDNAERGRTEETFVSHAGGSNLARSSNAVSDDEDLPQAADPPVAQTDIPDLATLYDLVMDDRRKIKEDRRKAKEERRKLKDEIQKLKDEIHEKADRNAIEEEITALKADRDSRNEDISTLSHLLEELAVLFAKSDAKKSFVSPISCSYTHPSDMARRMSSTCS